VKNGSKLRFLPSGDEKKKWATRASQKVGLGNNFIKSQRIYFDFKCQHSWIYHVAKEIVKCFLCCLGLRVRKEINKSQVLLQTLESTAEPYWAVLTDDWMKETFSEYSSQTKKVNLRDKDELCELYLIIHWGGNWSPLDKIWISGGKKYPIVKESNDPFAVLFNFLHVCVSFSGWSSIISKGRNCVFLAKNGICVPSYQFSIISWIFVQQKHEAKQKTCFSLKGKILYF